MNVWVGHSCPTKGRCPEQGHCSLVTDKERSSVQKSKSSDRSVRPTRPYYVPTDCSSKNVRIPAHAAALPKGRTSSVCDILQRQSAAVLCRGPRSRAAELSSRSWEALPAPHSRSHAGARPSSLDTASGRKRLALWSAGNSKAYQRNVSPKREQTARLFWSSLAGRIFRPRPAVSRKL
jgi:hypothetical protein